MEIGTKPIPISVLTAVTNSALNAASVFPSRRIEISDSHTDLNRSADINIQAIDAALQDFEVSAVRAWHVKVGKASTTREAADDGPVVHGCSFAFGTLGCA
jgi:hypothetical protein